MPAQNDLLLKNLYLLTKDETRQTLNLRLHPPRLEFLQKAGDFTPHHLKSEQL